MRKKIGLAFALALLAGAGACGRDARDPVEARPRGPSQEVRDSIQSDGIECDTTGRGGGLGSGGGKQGC